MNNSRRGASRRGKSGFRRRGGRMQNNVQRVMKNEVSNAIKRVIHGNFNIGNFQRTWPPTRIMAALTWDIIGDVTTTTSVGELVIAANNPNDPGLTLSATQPVWYDQLQAFYNRYRVHGSKIEVNFNSAESTTQPYELAVYPTRASTGVTTYSDAAAQPFAKVRQGGAESGNDRTRIVNIMSSSKIFGTNIQLSTDYSGQSNATPSLSWYWVIAHIGANSTSSTVNAYNIRLTQYIEFFDKASTDESTLLGILKKRKFSFVLCEDEKD